ncbi:PQQ-dependent sugar dehydrogenase [Myxococcota bacterium]|nr:PQQ-dependent sugar dehydrogenase [Myxococcota bacterium]
MLLLLLLCCRTDPGPGPTDDTASQDGGADPGTDGGGDGGGADGGTTDGGTPAPGEGPRCSLPASPPVAAGEVGLARAFPALSFDLPIFLTQAPGDAERWWVIEQQAGIRTWSGEDATEAPFALDLRDRLFVSYECGVLGLAFDPDFARNGHAWVVYTTAGTGGAAADWHLSRFTSLDGGQSFDPDSELVVLELAQPYQNHNGGALAFGPDGYLYVSVGDGGSAGDPLGTGQDPTDLFGAILRLDVSEATEGAPYAIPADNPFAAEGLFAGQPGAPEVYAWGLRNAWAMSFDRATGELWAGDVGQDRWEEIDRIEAGGNYGWSEMEGSACYQAGCETEGLLLPEAEYSHDEGRSVTGGVVYRGEALALVGAYLYADFWTGRLWALEADPRTGGAAARLLLEPEHSWSGFAQDPAGEVLLLSMYEGTAWRVVPAGEGEVSDFPQRLSETGCVDPLAPTQVAAGLLPYEVRHPFWSDGADKARWLSLPEGGVATVGEGGDLSLPAGSVVVKEFRRDGRPFETRLLVHHEDGSHAGYSYRWDEDGADATLLDGSLREDVAGQAWHYPSRAECRTCHTDVASVSLGLELAQLGEEVAAWREAGLLAGEAAVTPLVALDDPDLDAAARSYLHANCAFCHQPGGPGGGSLDLRWGVDLAESGLCAAPSQGDLGIEDARIVAPGEPARSVLLARIRDLGAARMPPLGSLQVDEAGAARIEEWIAAGACR